MPKNWIGRISPVWPICPEQHSSGISAGRPGYPPWNICRISVWLKRKLCCGQRCCPWLKFRADAASATVITLSCVSGNVTKSHHTAIENCFRRLRPFEMSAQIGFSNFRTPVLRLRSRRSWSYETIFPQTQIVEFVHRFNESVHIQSIT